jgi:glycosyltransferase involved in cell wall biosynthesis
VLAASLGVPYVVRILDDWPARYERRKGLREGAVWKPLMRRNLGRLFAGAALNLSISPEMSDAYEARYGHAFSHVSNCIDVKEWPLLKEGYDVSGEFTIVYMGDASEDKEFYSLKDLRDAVVSLRGRSYAIGMVIYGPPRWEKKVRERLADCDGISYGGYFDAAEKNRILSRADLLALPINFDENSAAYIRYSFQTKVPEYMASGTPVLVYAPEFSPNVRYALDGQWGYVVKERDRDLLEKAIVELQGSESLRERLGKRARQVAMKNHDARTVRREFREMIAGAAWPGRNGR